MPQAENAHRARAGAVSLKFGGFSSQHNRTANEIQHQPRFDGQRFERQIERLHPLGPRVLAEMLAEIARDTGRPDIVVDRVEEYTQLDPADLRAVGGDRFPAMPLGVVK